MAIKAKDKQAKILYAKFFDLLHHARIWSRQKHHTKRREIYKKDLLKQTDGIIARYMKCDDAEMIRFGKKLKTARNSLFTFVMDSDVPSTNMILRILFENV